MVERTPRIPASADSLAARLAAFPTHAGRMAEVVRQIDDLQEAAEIIERDAGVATEASNELIGVSISANNELCAVTPTSLGDCLIIATTALVVAEFVADNQDEGDSTEAASRAVVAALKGIAAHLEASA
ncbi:hypothetical protein ACFSTI_19550 [Rhizorhabdus histidinilytica]|uniref:Uncharacterized protein n=1 Tax=Rhizorhabdus histidinilytica TaxID=439228 RepID=A0A1T5BXV6_9SPHN|nr:hypothetical protein [Rhizorhabdus histidinilytica]SKB51833.1 hypothetical protein SAMN06295920_103359 [Rhizorhabdus histidinilytica]